MKARSVRRHVSAGWLVTPATLALLIWGPTEAKGPGPIAVHQDEADPPATGHVDADNIINDILTYIRTDRWPDRGSRGSRALNMTGGSYRDKHGNPGTIILGSPIVNPGAGGIDYTVPYTSTDSEGNKSGEYTITSEMLPGAPGFDDFVLNVFVSDDDTQNAAELVIRNNPDVAPLAPILRLLDCSSSPCVEVMVYDDPKWGCWIIQDQADIADYPIELLDTRVIIQLLEPSQLSELPNSDDGTGNWAEIMENHRTNFKEAQFRADVDHLGEPQSDLLTSRMIDEIEAHHDGSPDDWLVRHLDIQHHALTFLTDHRALIEDMTTVLFNDHFNNWPLDFTFPFGRMPIWLVDPDLDADSGNFHVLPTHWEQVISGLDLLDNAGCYHDWPLDGYTPTQNNGSMNLGQYECAEVIIDGFVDRPCTEASDYFAMGIDGDIDGELEGAWHDDIHPFIGGSFGSPATTAGTMVFWIFHTYASTTELSNWRYAQKRDMGTPMASPVAMCRPFSDFADADCCIIVDVIDIDDGSFDPDGEDDIDTLCITEVDGIPVGCQQSVVVCDEGAHVVTLTITDLDGESDSCDAMVTIFDITPPDIECPDDITVTCGEPTDPSATGMATADDNCDPDPLIEFDDTVIDSTCPADPVDFVIERTWTATDDSGNSSDCLQVITVLKVVLPLDIKPGSCPNSYNRGSNGVLPVGLLGTAELDVSTIDIATILISRADCIGGAVAPIMGRLGAHPVLADVGTPFKGDPCDCHELEGDGIIDWSLKFSTSELVEALELDTLPAGSTVELVVSGQLDDGCGFIATDCVRLVPPWTLTAPMP